MMPVPSDAITTPVLILQVARVAHEANRAWCVVNGDDSQPEWTVAPEWQRTSAIEGVKFHLDNPNASASSSHENWLKHKVAEGWVYGEVKDPDRKTHPCIAPFDQLPPVQQAKDRLFRAIVHAIANDLPQQGDAPKERYAG